jgi:hypothetical protein
MVAHESKDRSVSMDAFAESPCHVGWALPASVCLFRSSYAIRGRVKRAARPASLAVGAPTQRARKACALLHLPHICGIVQNERQ